MRLGKPLRDPRFEREWREGISVYDDLGYALDAARKLRGRLGAFVVLIEIPPNGPASYQKTMANPRHFTVYGSPEMLRSLVRCDAVAIDE